MKVASIIVAVLLLFNCGNNIQRQVPQSQHKQIAPETFSPGTWQYFLQHLPVKDGPILDYSGEPVSNQAKHVAIVNYDVGTADLQQCADALMRLRSEYLFSAKRYNEIGFHFCSGQFYSWSMYCKGLRPVVHGNAVKWVIKSPSPQTHLSLRSYLNIVYAYASTISLCKELKPADSFTVGTVIITPGSPGHTCIITDEAIAPDGTKVFKITEGYSPAQSIYILSNPYEPALSPWYHLQKGEITTASCRFVSYRMKKFE
jgi:hypothetical protein